MTQSFTEDRMPIESWNSGHCTATIRFWRQLTGKLRKIIHLLQDIIASREVGMIKLIHSFDSTWKIYFLHGY